MTLTEALKEVDRQAAAARRSRPVVASPLVQVPYQPMIAARDPRWARVLESIALADEQEAADNSPTTEAP